MQMKCTALHLNSALVLLKISGQQNASILTLTIELVLLETSDTICPVDALNLSALNHLAGLYIR